MGYINDIQEGATKIYDVTLKDIMESCDLILSSTKFVSPGGGIIGCTLAIGFKKLFSIDRASISVFEPTKVLEKRKDKDIDMPRL